MHEPLDHRELNRDLAVFATDALAGAGLPLWLPDGAVIREELQALAKEIARADGCQSVFTPVLGKRALFERSGHLAKFADDMFPPMAVGGDELDAATGQLPAPRAGLRGPPALVPGAADPVQRARCDVPRRAVRGALRAEPGPPDQPRRHPRVLPTGPGRRRGGPGAALGAAGPARSSASPSTTSGCRGAGTDRATSDRPRSGSPPRRRSGAPRRACSTAASSSSTRPVRRRSTGPSSISRCATGAARGDDRHRAGRLRPAAALRPHVRRRRRLPAARDDGAPRHGRGDGTCRRRPARALPGAAARLAGAGAGGRAARRRRPGSAPPGRSPTTCSPPGSGRASTSTARWVPACARAGSGASRSSPSSAPRRPPPTPCRRATSPAASRWSCRRAAFVAALRAAHARRAPVAWPTAAGPGVT